MNNISGKELNYLKDLMSWEHYRRPENRLNTEPAVYTTIWGISLADQTNTILEI